MCATDKSKFRDVSYFPCFSASKLDARYRDIGIFILNLYLNLILFYSSKNLVNNSEIKVTIWLLKFKKNKEKKNIEHI